MPKLDLGSLNWNRWFDEDPLPAWPDWLTKKSWDKKKSLTAKATATGIGEGLETARKSFEKVVAQRVVVQPRNLDEVEGHQKRAEAFLRNPATKALHEDLKQLRELAKKAQAAYKKSKAPGLKSTIDLCGDIEDAADKLMVAFNKNSLGTLLEKQLEQRVASLHEQARKLIGPTLQTCRTVPRKVLDQLDEMESMLDVLEQRQQTLGDNPDPKVAEELEADWKEFRSRQGDKLRTLSRDMTQPLLNFRKAMQAGVVLEGVDERDLDRLRQLLVPYGNDGKATITRDTPDQIRLKIADVRTGARLFEPIARDVRIA
jgi:hypothetical protein